MHRQDIVFPAANGEHNIHGYLLLPDDAERVRGLIQLVHGMAEHIERYLDFAGFLVDKGFAVCADNHAGHGKSHAGVRGYMGASKGYRHMITDLHTLSLKSRDRLPVVPYIMLGHSMGSFMARLYCKQYGHQLDGIIYSGTGNQGRQARLGLSICRGATALGLSKKPGVLFERIVSHANNKSFKPRRTGYEWLSRDIAAVDAFVADDDCGFMFTYGGYADLFGMIAEVTADDWAWAVPKDLPTYIFSGDKDPVGDYGNGVRAVYQKLIMAGCTNVKLKLYQHGRHEMLNEINRDEVYRDVLTWIESVV